MIFQYEFIFVLLTNASLPLRRVQPVARPVLASIKLTFFLQLIYTNARSINLLTIIIVKAIIFSQENQNNIFLYIAMDYVYQEFSRSPNASIYI